MSDPELDPTRVDQPVVPEDPTLVGQSPVPMDDFGGPPTGGIPPGGAVPPPPDRRPWLIAGLLALIVLVLILILLFQDDDEDAAETTSTTTSSVTSTSSSTTSPSTTTTAAPTTTEAAIVTVPPEECAEEGEGEAQPGAAATTVFEAWVRGDQACAAELMTPSALEELFSRDGEGATDEFQGCTESEEPGLDADCAFTYEGGATHYLMSYSDDDGWIVEDVTQVAD